MAFASFSTLSSSLKTTRGDLRVEVSKAKNEKGDEIETIHVFRGGRMERSINLTDHDLHGKVYFDEQFGCLSVSPDLKKVVFVAEEKKKANRPYLKVKVGKVRHPIAQYIVCQVQPSLNKLCCFEEHWWRWQGRATRPREPLPRGVR